MEIQNPNSSTMSKSAEIVASIDDLLTQILLRLPIKSLIRFKSVSKHWLSLIKNPQFCHLRNPVPNPVIGFFCDIQDNQTYQYIPLFPQVPRIAPPSINLKDRCSIFNSCNGLMLLCGVFGDRNWNWNLRVYNPTTNCVFDLPELGGTQRPSGGTLVFDPVESPHYKVVVVRSILLAKGRTNQIEIYSSESGVWSIGGEIESGSVVTGKGVYWNGAVHWICERGNPLRFHVDTKVLDEMPATPVRHPVYWSNEYYFYFGESCGHLHYMEVEPGLLRFNVYEMKRDYSGWFVKYTVDLSPVVAAYPEVIRGGSYPAFYVLSLVRAEKEEDAVLVIRIPRKAVKLNLVDGRLEKLYEFEGDGVEDFLGSFDERGFEYIQSLCCV